MKTSYRLVVAEKPSVAASIAAVLEANDHKDGFFIGNGWIVSWCYGHLVELAPPAAYGDQYKRWDRAVLPILPETWKYTTSEGKRRQLDILRSLMSRTDVATVVNACDAGREGELIFCLVYDQCKCKKPVQRLWISSLENAAIREGFDNLRPGADYDNLCAAARCRSQADWMVGINATRLFSCLYGACTLSVGRVQSPTLAMIVDREAEVAAFQQEPFYTPVIDCGAFVAAGDRQADAAAAADIRAAADGRDAVVLSVEKTRKTVAPPKLYDLTTLQREANRLLGFTAQQTLDYAQSLYEKKLITYPRTDSRFLTSHMEDGIPALVNRVADLFSLFQAPPEILTEQVINDAGVTDHHAIIPTMGFRTSDLTALPSGELAIYDLISTRLLCAVSPAQEYEAVTVTLKCGGQRFTAKGRAILDDGWKAIDNAFRASLKNKPDTCGDDSSAVLPELSEGQVFPAVKATIREGQTKPPARYTEDTLLRAMETAGAEEMPDDAERKGLGTPATRSGIIEKLIKSGYVTRQERNLVPSEKGINLIAILPDEIKSPLLTAGWEQQLKQVERGELSGTAFMSGIAALTQRLVSAHTAPQPEYASLFAPPPKGDVVGHCPRCGAVVTESGKGFFCSSRACRFALWKDNRFFEAKGKKIDKNIVAALLTEGRVFFSDLVSAKTGKTYAAAIVLDDTGDRANFKLEFEKGRQAA